VFAGILPLSFGILLNRLTDLAGHRDARLKRGDPACSLNHRAKENELRLKKKPCGLRADVLTLHSDFEEI
jgi:hypothetical protein